MSMKLTHDYLPGTQIYLHQRKDMFRMNTDTALLGKFMKVKENDTVMDIGTNNGALLLYASQFTSNKLIGIEVQKEAAELAEMNLRDNSILDYEIIHADIKDVTYPVDVVVCNPPYFVVTQEKQLNENEYKRIARHECYLTLNTLCESVKRNLKEKGRFYLVHRADRIVDILCCLREHELEVKTIQMIRDENNEVAHGILIEAVKEGKVHCTVLPEIIVRR